MQKYGNMSSATAPVALVEAVEEGRVAPGTLVLMPAFGGGLTLSAHLIRWDSASRRFAPSDAERRASMALELVNEIRAEKKRGEAEAARFETLGFAENRTGPRRGKPPVPQRRGGRACDVEYLPHLPGFRRSARLDCAHPTRRRR